jgi:ATP-binding cassette subfamily B protein
MSSNDPVENPSLPGTVQVTTRLLRRFMPGELRGIIIGLLLVLGSSGAALLQPWPLKLVLDSVIGTIPPPAVVSSIMHLFGGDAFAAAHQQSSLLVVLCVALLLIELLLGGLNVASAYLLHSVALRMVFKLRCALFDHVQRLSLAFHDRSAVGDSLYRVTWDSYCIQSIFSEGVVPALTAGTTLLGIAVVMLNCDWRITVAALSVAVPLLFLVRRMEKPMTEQSLLVHEQESEVSTRVQETLVGIRTVQAFGQEQFESDRFQSKANASLQANLRLTVVQTASQAVVGLVLAAGTAGVIWLGAQAVLQHRITYGTLVLLVAYVAMIFKPLETLAYTASAVQSATAGARRVMAVLDSAPEVV